MKVVVLGTGATSGTLQTAGGVDSFVKRLESAKPDWKQQYADLARVIDDCEENPEQLGLDRLWSRLDYYSKFKLILGPEYGTEAAIQIRKAISDAYSFVDEIAKLCTMTSDFTLKRVLRGLVPGDSLVSFNWDTLAETILKDMLGQDVVQAPHPDANSHIRLIKPHGSLSWVHRSTDSSVVFRDGSKPLYTPMTSSQIQAWQGGFAQPLLLGAVPIKSELLEEIQRSQAGIHETVANQWREALDVFSRATAIEVVGYRFPREDDYGRFLIREAVRRRTKGSSSPSILYYALRGDRHAFEKSFREIFGTDVNYEFAGEVESAW